MTTPVKKKAAIRKPARRAKGITRFTEAVYTAIEQFDIEDRPTNECIDEICLMVNQEFEDIMHEVKEALDIN